MSPSGIFRHDGDTAVVAKDSTLVDSTVVGLVAKDSAVVDLAAVKLAVKPMPTALDMLTFKYILTRAHRTTNWGVDFASASDQSLTVVALAPGHALAVCNNAARAYGATELLPGDVIVAIDGATKVAEMVEKLKHETSLTADIVRHSKFDAVIHRNPTFDAGRIPTQESLGMTLIRSGGRLVIDGIDLSYRTGSSNGMSAIMSYNAKNHLKPLVKGDVVVAVDGKATDEEMLKQITTSQQFTLSIERRPGSSSAAVAQAA
jgi:hypothetical protein